MPFVRSLASKCYIYIIVLILLLSEIILTCFYYAVKGFIYIAIITSFN
jgi:hypothetical protein